METFLSMKETCPLFLPGVLGIFIQKLTLAPTVFPHIQKSNYKIGSCPILLQKTNNNAIIHCSCLFYDIKSVVGRYSDIQFTPEGEERMIGDWEKCERLVDR
mgnify:CR=1 FL=1